MTERESRTIITFKSCKRCKGYTYHLNGKCVYRHPTQGQRLRGESVRPRRIRLTASLGPFQYIPMGEFKVMDYARNLYEKASEGGATVRLCPRCGGKPEWQGGYRCPPPCGAEYKHWSQLKWALGNGVEIVRQRLIPPKEVPQASIHFLPREEYSKNHVSAVEHQYGIIPEDEKAAKNLRLLLVAVSEMGHVIILRFPDNDVWRVCSLTVGEDARVVLNELVPTNLLEVEETLRMDISGIRPELVEQAKALLANIPRADETVFQVDDYRAQVAGAEPAKAAPAKTRDLEEILVAAARRG